MMQYIFAAIFAVIIAVQSCTADIQIKVIPEPVLEPTLTIQPTQTYLWIDPTPTPGEPIPTITPTWSSCEALCENGNCYVRVTVAKLNVRLQTISDTQDPMQQKVVGSVVENELLEIDSCLLDFTPGGWLPIMTSSGLQGIVRSDYTKPDN